MITEQEILKIEKYKHKFKKLHITAKIIADRTGYSEGHIKAIHSHRNRLMPFLEDKYKYIIKDFEKKKIVKVEYEKRG